MYKGFTEKEIDGLTVSWKVLDSGDGFKVEAKYGEIRIIDYQLLNERTPVLPFSVCSSGENYGIEGCLRWGIKHTHFEKMIPILDLDLYRPINKIIRLYPDEDPIPNPPAPFEYLDLFPYVCICPWSQIHQKYLEDRFITYEQTVETKTGEGDTLSFYKTLSDLKENKDRARMEDESVKFIHGENPYKGQFLSKREELQSILKYYEPLGRWMLRQLKVDFESLSVEVEKLVGSWDEVIESIETPEYKAEKERLWETLFALNITLGYDFRILEGVTITLVTARMLEKISDLKSAVLPDKTEALEIEKLEGDETGSEFEEVIEDTVNEAPEEIETIENKSYFNPPSPEELYRWAHATILLPDPIFPLPPFQDSKICESGEFVKPSVIPYAIGELQMVQYRLRGYQLGEVSHIENILKGECKEVKERQFMQLKESELLGQQLQDEKNTELENGTADFLNEVHRTLSPRTTVTEIKNYKTSYGIQADNIVDINGSWNVVENPAGGDFENKTGFAKDVVSRTVSRISQKINWMRTKSSLSESEEKVMHRFDNTGGESNVLGIYRWLNKVYSLRTVNRGNALVLELHIEKPAASFLKNECQFYEIRLEKPVSPAERKLKSYKNVSESDKYVPESEEEFCYYLDFFSMYDVPELLPPPPKSKVVTVVLESAKPFCKLNCEIPEGYEAETARISISFKDVSSKVKVKVMVGNAVREYSADDPQIDLIKLELEQPNVEQTSIPISIMCSDSQKDAENTVNYYLANVEIECKLTDNLFREWQLLAFRKIMQGYSKQKAEYYQQIEHQMNKILPPSPHLSRIVESQQLKRNAFNLFWNICFEHIGMKNVEKEQIIGYMMDKPKYFQFFRNSLEWKEMTYYIHPAWDDAENDDFFLDTDIEEILRTEYFEQSDFLNFLKASSVRILLPVKPEFTFKFLYFLSSGLVWPGNDDLVPATSLHESLVNEIKTLRECKTEGKAVENTWEITVPTPLVILQADSSLLEIDE